MKPTVESIRKVAGELTAPHELSMLKDNLAFFRAGVRESALALRTSANEIAALNRVEALLDKARAAEEFINDRIQTLGRKK